MMSVEFTVFVGSYQNWPIQNRGGLTVVTASDGGAQLRLESSTDSPKEAGYLVYSPKTQTLYSVDERKTDGKGPVDPPASVQAFRYDSETKALSFLNSLRALAPRPTYLSLSPDGQYLACASHGDFDHVEKVVKTATGWTVEYHYDDSAALLYSLKADGALDQLEDVMVFNQLGIDPNDSPQANHHGQASGHAHCATYHPGGKYLVVCDKATDEITVLTAAGSLKAVSVLHTGAQTGPRHIAFSSNGDWAVVTFEFSSELALFKFDAGTLVMIDKIKTVAAEFQGLNEPADVRIHPSGKFIYVNNRGEDSIAWFEKVSDKLVRKGHHPLAKSIHPGLAARSFMIAPTGDFLLLADRPVSEVKSFSISANGSLTLQTAINVPNCGFIEFS
jgi:6-phosphogluconolactonase